MKYLCSLFKEAQRLYSLSEGRRAAGFIALRIHHPWPGFNQRTFGGMASTLNVTPPRTIFRTFKVNVNDGKH
jgi:hypothetical protein